MEQGDSATPAQTGQFHHWREVGWIFRDDVCIAIERQYTEHRSQVSTD
jgi:hypothetical protein